MVLTNVKGFFPAEVQIEVDCANVSTTSIEVVILIDDSYPIYLAYNQQCVHCLNNCSFPNGECVDEEVCVCQKGWSGSSCDTALIVPDFACQLQPFNVFVHLPPEHASATY